VKRCVKQGSDTDSRDRSSYVCFKPWYVLHVDSCARENLGVWVSTQNLFNVNLRLIKIWVFGYLTLAHFWREELKKTQPAKKRYIGYLVPENYRNLRFWDCLHYKYTMPRLRTGSEPLLSQSTVNLKWNFQ
jgi:hypothetical protein